MTAVRPPNPFAVLLLAVALAYSSAINTGFVFDDNLWIANSPTLGDARAYLSESRSRWLVSLTVVLNHRLGSLNPLGYHLFNVGVHALAVLVLFALLRRVLALPRFGGRFDGRGEFLAFAVALLWAVHPLNTQAVTYVIQRAESMMGLFFLLTFYCWTRGATGGPPRLWHPLALLSYFACCHCKEVCVALPPVLWAFDRALLADRWRMVFRARGLPHLGILAIWGYALWPVFATAVGGGTDTGVGFGLAVSPYHYLLTESEVILHYLRLAVYPVGQCGDLVDWPVATSLGQVWPAFAAVGAAFAAGAVLLAVRPAVGFLFAWFFVILAPTSSVMPIQDVAFEHRMYLPLIGLLAGLVFAVDAAMGAVRFRAAVSVALLAITAVALGRMALLRNEVYRTSERFLESVLEARPNNSRAKAGIAGALVERGQFDEAQRMLDELRAAGAGSLTLRVALGQVAHRNGRFERAADYFRDMLTDPWPYMPRLVLPFLIPSELAAKRYAAAAGSARALAEKFPESAAYRMTLAACELAAGNAGAARAAVADAVARDPNAANGYAASARGALFAKHPIPAARPGLWEVAYRNAAAANLAANDAHPEWLDTEAQLAARIGRFADAVTAGERGLAASANDPIWRAAHAERLKSYRANRTVGPVE